MPTAPDYGGPVPTVHTKEHTSTAVMEKPAETIVTEESPETIPEYIIIGQAFNTYIVIEIEDVLIYIDQHAAHERKIYEELLKQDTISSQMLISGVNIALTKTEMASVLGNMPVLEKLGFEIDPFGENVIMVRSTPIELPTPELKDTILEIVGKIDDNYQDLTSDARENAVHTLACKAAVKGNKKLHPEEIRPLVEWVLEQNNNQTCPHGRPLTYKISKRELDKLFKRIV
jgi:DNA mismatch repair protein MutL